jgi:serine/threonine protein kinase
VLAELQLLTRKSEMHGMKTKVGSHEYVPGALVAEKYRLLHRLGQGGMGSIWAAHNPTLDISVALKLIRMDLAGEDAHARLIQEARATARLADPGIVRIFDVGHTEQGDPFISMELLTGTNLRQALDGGPFDPVRAVRTLLPIVRALECAHRAGIVHRDVKPDNIVLAVGARGDMQPKLVDFGVAKILTRPNELTSVGATVGSPLYMSPEQARGEPIDARTDLWSICVVLYESIMGAPPFDAINSNALLHAIATQAAPTLGGRGVCDSALSKIIDRGLCKRREERWQHARDLTLALAEWLRSQGVTDDITGLSLRGRGVGQRSSMPVALRGNDDGPRAQPNAATVVNQRDRAPASVVGARLSSGAARAPASAAALAPTALGPSPEQRTGALMWGALSFIALALVLLGMLFWGRPTPVGERVARPAGVLAPAAMPSPASPSPASPPPVASSPTAPAPASEPATTASDLRSESPAREATARDARPANDAQPTSGSAKTTSSARSARPRDKAAHAAVEPRPRSAKPIAPKPSTPPPSRVPAPFKNPFE